MKERIEQAVAALVGLPLSSSVHVGNFMMFRFGGMVSEINLHGKRVEVAEYSLHVSCHWRIAGSKGILVGARDLYYPADEAVDPEDFDYETSESRLDRRMSDFWNEHAHHPLVVQSVECDDLGSLRLRLTEDFSIELFPDDSGAEERWRMIRSGDESKHFVVTGVGIEEQQA